MATTLVLSAQTPIPPVAKQVEHTSVWHGEKVSDPWFWLRNKANPEVADYLQAENAYTEAMTADLRPFSEALYQEMLGRIKQTDLSVPTRHGAYFYYSRTEEGKQYAIQCRRKATPKGSYDEHMAEEVLLDPNELARGLKFISIGALSVSNDDRTLLFSTDTTGFRQYQLFTRDLSTGRISAPLAERVTAFTWTGDLRHILYATEDAVTKRSNQVWRLDLEGGKPELVFEERDELFRVSVERTRDKAFLLLTSSSTDTWEQQVLPAASPTGTFKVVLPRRPGHKYSVDHREHLFYILTNKDAKNFRMVTAPDSDPSEANWKPFVAHDPKVLLNSIDLFRNFGVLFTQTEGLNHLRIIDFRTGHWRELNFPESVYTTYPAENPEYDSDLYRYTYQSLVTPPSVYDCALETLDQTLLKQTEVLGGYDKSAYVTERLWATARDGVKVPLSVVYRKGIKHDGNSPLFLYGYGSYGFGMNAGFNSSRLSLLDRGMIYVIAHIRGGNEMGEAWHDDGMLMKKMNTFNDFIDSAEFLVKTKWTRPDRLVIEGGSAGGLLMGAVTNLRPDLFKAVHAAVPFVDVMNTMLDATLPLTVGEYLEWGNPNEKPAFDCMRAYSPYDNLGPRAYPALLVTSSFNDSQVMYWEPAKYVAKLRTLKTDRNPLLLKMKMEPAGHGGASGRYDALKDRAFEMAWILSQVGITR
jgi:oligopeptidase B